MKTGYYVGDAFKEIEGKTYDYLFFSPPCYEDLNFLGVDVKNPWSYKLKFLDLIVPQFNSRLGTVTVSFTGSRRNNGRILPKSYYLQHCFFSNGYYLRDLKHVMKSNKYNAYSHQCIDVYTFQKDGTKSINNLRKEKLYDTYGKDVWGPFNKEILLDGQVVGQPIEIAEWCIEQYTNPGHIVFDPFAGIGSTLAAAKRHKRKYLGFEIRESLWMFGKEKFKL